ncbi:MAG: RagB/SusD family nutrient uptake outer membrane protein [Bacteroidales bacterium]|jgi:hypothetical protein|nr:RagB/SusD family nutrient uptake outer membrane protein [Bacteroidales bacterium]
MKKISIIISSTIILLGLASCSLNEDPYGFYSENNFYITAADAESAVNYIYDAMNYIEFSRDIVFLGDMNTDEMDPKSDCGADTQTIDNWDMTNYKTNVRLGNLFKYAYIIINRANSVIANVPGMNIEESLKNRYTGEGYFMRAYAYYFLATNFGKVPIHKTPVTTAEETSVPAASSLDEMWNFIISDFAAAADLLPYYKTPEAGRADKVAAYGFLAKSYLYIASAKDHGVPQYREMNFNVDDYYSKAAEAAAMVVDNPEQTVFGFSSSLTSIYDVNKPDGPEHIFIMSMDRTGEGEGQFSKIDKMYIPYISGSTVYIKNQETGRMNPNHDGWGEYRTNINFYNSYSSTDRRKTWLIADKAYDASGNVIADYSQGTLSYPFCIKYTDPSFSGDKTSTRPYLLRYSDIALVYAEAEGPSGKSYELVNYIRNRAGLGDLDPTLDKEAFRRAILNERTYELAFEGNHCYDLRRWNKMQDITAAKARGLTSEDMVFYPIPSIETDLNNSIN